VRTEEYQIVKISFGFKKFFVGLDWSINVCGAIAGLLLLCLCPIALYEVIVRKLGTPTVWAFHILGYIQIFIIWLAMAYTQKVRGHVAVDLVTIYLPLKYRLFCRVLSSFFCLILSAILCWQGWRLVLRSYLTRQMTVEELHHPVYWVQIPVIIGAVLLFLIFGRQLISEIRWCVTKEGLPKDI